MSEFEKQRNDEENTISFLSIQGQAIPPDFSEEDLAFVQELNTLFSPSEEELPPYFVQTLLQSEDPRFRPVERGFEQKMNAHVFRRLELRRRLFYAYRSPLFAISAISEAIRGVAARRSLLALAATFMLVMIFTVAFTAPSFASGMAILLQGANTGTFNVTAYPQTVRANPAPLNNSASQAKRISPFAVQQQLHFSIYWPQSMPASYTLDKIYLETDQQWADGPVLDLQYALINSKVDTQDADLIVVREFKPKQDVLQVVHDGAARPIQMDQYGRARAIYVDGQWFPVSGDALPQWVYGGRSELIYQQDGVVFWIAGNQHDGIGQKALLTIAQSLQVFHMSYQMHMYDELRYITQVIGGVAGPFTTDVVRVSSDNNGGSPYYMSVSSYQSVKTTQINMANGDS